MKISKLSAAVGIFAFCVGFASIRAQDNPAQAAAREALMKAMNQGQAPAAQKPPTAPAAPVAPATPVVVTPTPAAEPASADTNAEAQAAARAAVLQMMHAQNPQQPMAAAPARPSIAAPPAAPAMASQAPIVAPPIPISATKEERLQALLALYKADQITPEEYQKRRAAILADP